MVLNSIPRLKTFHVVMCMVITFGLKLVTWLVMSLPQVYQKDVQNVFALEIFVACDPIDFINVSIANIHFCNVKTCQRNIYVYIQYKQMLIHVLNIYNLWWYFPVFNWHIFWLFPPLSWLYMYALQMFSASHKYLHNMFYELKFSVHNGFNMSNWHFLKVVLVHVEVN